jgi:ABC-type phosphate transport system auxiliary subunit
MTEPGAVMLAMIIIGLPVIMLMLIANRFFRLREKKLEVEAGMAAEKAAQYAARTHELEQRVQVLEQIVTDRGIETAAQIDALRKAPTRRIGGSQTPAGTA